MFTVCGSCCHGNGRCVDGGCQCKSGFQADDNCGEYNQYSIKLLAVDYVHVIHSLYHKVKLSLTKIMGRDKLIARGAHEGQQRAVCLHTGCILHWHC